MHELTTLHIDAVWFMVPASIYKYGYVWHISYAFSWRYSLYLDIINSHGYSVGIVFVILLHPIKCSNFTILKQKIEGPYKVAAHFTSTLNPASGQRVHDTHTSTVCMLKQ